LRWLLLLSAMIPIRAGELCEGIDAAARTVGPLNGHATVNRSHKVLVAEGA